MLTLTIWSLRSPFHLKASPPFQREEKLKKKVLMQIIHSRKSARFFMTAQTRASARANVGQTKEVFHRIFPALLHSNWKFCKKKGEGTVLGHTSLFRWKPHVCVVFWARLTFGQRQQQLWCFVVKKAFFSGRSPVFMKSFPRIFCA